ncbi:hypothetical protein PIROE2DRAFT_11350 [Piromyces sp. E2]|nr:hypothetical protein PIROE2DRAFT_11350 [Piromyces sp. E2]|eukprot:OUM62390.1 hypothetical protein PIROE2DRAFT_11350 [Piromyces sp. E2]
MSVESDDILYEYIYHLNVTTNSIENCEYCDTTICKDCKICKRLEKQVNSISTECTKDGQCFTNKCVNNTYLCVNKYDCSEGECDRKCYIPDPPKVEGEFDSLFRSLEILGVLIFIAIFGISIIAIALVRNVLGAIEEGQYYNLNGATARAFLFIGEDDCNKVYFCKERDYGFWGFIDDIYNCYLRSEYIDKVDKIFGPGDRDSPSNEVNIPDMNNYKLKSGKPQLVQEFLDHKIPIITRFN